MAEADGLTSPTGGEAAGDGTSEPHGRAGSAGGPGVALEPRLPTHRATVYWVLAGVLLLGTLLLREAPWSWAGGELHLVVETTSVVLAAVVGALALVRFHSRTTPAHLFVGVGFLGAAALEVQHLALTAGLGASAAAGFGASGGAAEAPGQDVLAWSWLASRSFLAVFLLASRIPGEDDGGTGSRPMRVPPGAVYLAGGVLVTAALLLLAFAPLPAAYRPELGVPRPAELLPGVVFLAALGLSLRRDAWRRDPFEHWLVVALLVYASVHVAYMPFSRGLDDTGYTVAHLLKVAGHGAIFVGLVMNVFVATRREVRAVDQIRDANEALADEVAIRRRAERVLQDSEDRLQDFLDNANDLIQSTDPDGTVLYVNRAWMHTLGYEEEDVLGRPVWDFVHPASRERCERFMERALAGESVSGTEVEFLAADGRTVLCSGSANCRFEDGEPVAVRSIFRDVTGQREAEREIAASRANLEALVESTGDVIWSVNEHHRLITFNTSFALSMEARTGREPRRGDEPGEVFRPEEAAWYREQYDRALSGERVSVLRREELEGQTRHFEYFFNPIVEARGICGVVAFGRDVTRRIHAEEALRLAKEEAEAANRAKSQFLANMSHELRTPLNSVIGFTKILQKQDDGSLSEKQRTFLERVHANGRHLLTLINEVLDLAKIEAGRMELDIEPVELEELVAETLAQLEGQARAKKGERVKLRPDVPEGLEPLETDRAKLKQVIINLVGNALKFTEEGEVAVIVEPSPDGGRAHAIHVRDTGIGIPDDRLEAIFEAFQQADASTSRKYGGTGLGLTISRSICQMLGYGMGVDSEVGVGSTFTIHLSDAPPRRSREAEAARGVAHGRALVVEHDDDARERLSRLLRDGGWAVDEAAAIDAGVERARASLPDLMVVELALPEGGGWEAVRRIRSDPDLAEMPVVLVTSGSGETEDGSMLGTVDVLELPVDGEALRTALRRALEGASPGRVLVIEPDEDVRRRLKERIEESDGEANVTVATAANGAEALRALGDARPDAIVVDLLMPVMDGVTFLDRLRRVPEHLATPVVVLTREHDRHEDAYLRRQAQTARRSSGGRFEERLGACVEMILDAGRPPDDGDESRSAPQ